MTCRKERIYTRRAQAQGQEERAHGPPRPSQDNPPRAPRTSCSTTHHHCSSLRPPTATCPTLSLRLRLLALLRHRRRTGGDEGVELRGDGAQAHGRLPLLRRQLHRAQPTQPHHRVSTTHARTHFTVSARSLLSRLRGLLGLWRSRGGA